MRNIYPLHRILQLRRVCAEQVWIAQRQMFHEHTSFEACMPRVLACRLQMSLADGCTCDTRIGRRIFVLSLHVFSSQPVCGSPCASELSACLLQWLLMRKSLACPEAAPARDQRRRFAASEMRSVAR